MKRVLLFAICYLPIALFAQTSQSGSDYVAKRIQLTLSNPPQPVTNASVSVVGNPGPATYYYWIVTKTSVGASSPAGPFQVSNAPNALGASNFNQISWATVGVATYDVLRTSTPAAPSGACSCAVTTAVAGNSVNDQSNLTLAYTVNTLDPGTLTVILQNINGTLGLPGLTIPSLTVTGNVVETIGQNQYRAFSINSVLWVDGIRYTSIITCYADLPVTGGVCMVPPNYSEIVLSNFVCNKPYSGIHFTGPAAISWGANTISVAVGTPGCFFASDVPLGSVILTQNTGVVFNYTGNSTLLTVGNSSADTITFGFKNIAINLNNAGTSAVAMDVIRTARCEITNPTIIGNNGVGFTQQGIILDGTGNFTGCIITNPIVGGAFKAIQLTGSGVNAANANQIIGGNIFSPPPGSSIGIDFEASAGENLVLGTDVEQYNTCVNFGATSLDNKVTARCEADTNDCAFAAGTSRNKFEAMASPVGTCNDLGTNNSIVDASTSGVAKDGTLRTSSTSRVANLTAQRHALSENCQGINPCAAAVANNGFLVFAPGAGAVYTMSAGTLTVTGFPFAAANSFTCSPTNATSTNAIKVVNNSGSSVTFSSAGASDQFTFICVGT